MKCEDPFFLIPGAGWVAGQSSQAPGRGLRGRAGARHTESRWGKRQVPAAGTTEGSRQRHTEHGSMARAACLRSPAARPRGAAGGEGGRSGRCEEAQPGPADVTRAAPRAAPLRAAAAAASCGRRTAPPGLRERRQPPGLRPRGELVGGPSGPGRKALPSPPGAFASLPGAAGRERGAEGGSGTRHLGPLRGAG